MSFCRLYALLIAALLLPAALTRAAADIDPASPKGAMKSFYEAMEAGDAAAVRASFYTATDSEKALADAYAAQLTAAKTLGDAAKSKYGATGDALSKGMPVRDEIARLDAAEVAIDGDTASLKVPGQAKPLRLVKFDGRWRLLIADFAGTTPENIAGQTAVIKEMAAVFNAVAADITADKFPGAPDAQRALQQKLGGVLFNTLQKHPPTTAPAAATTRPKA
ncbi:MAG: hypothetical protein JWN40_2756 [Phycisphaerales bacterium]|nr:hypothetical protein [Phycisphaerales bacterium]